MKFSAQLLALSFLVTDGARASHQQRREVASKDVESPIPGYGVFVPSWEISATPGGPKIILNGTAQEVHDQLLELNPNFDEDFGLHEPITEGSDTSDDAAGLTKRNIFPGNAGYNCFGRWGFVFTDTLWDGIDYLRRVGGQPSNGPGPGNCGRVSCSYRTAIHWCNDNAHRFTLSTFGHIADGAQRIHDVCFDYVGYERDIRTSGGQVFHPDGWNVIVRDENC